MGKNEVSNEQEDGVIGMPRTVKHVDPEGDGFQGKQRNRDPLAGKEAGTVYSHFRCDISGTDPVHLHIVLTPLVTERLGELTQSTFRRGVGWDCKPTLEGKERTEIYDFTATKGHHVATGSLR